MRHLCLPVHSIHRGFCSGTVDGSPQHSRIAWPQQFLWWWNRDLPVLVPKRQRGKKKRKKSQITGQVIMKWKTWIYEQSKANPHPAQTDGSKSVCDRFLKTAKWSLPVFFLFFKKKTKQTKQNHLYNWVVSKSSTLRQLLSDPNTYFNSLLFG